MTDLERLTEKYRQQITQLETQISEVKRKINVVTEALRLLEEEGLSEKPPCIVGTYNP